MAERVTVWAPLGATLAKTVHRRRDGSLEIIPSAKHTEFVVGEIEVADHDALGALVEDLAGSPEFAATRGALNDHGAALLQDGLTVPRLLRDRPAEKGRPAQKATVEDVPRRWLCLDADDFPADLHDLQHAPEVVVESMITECLPSPFHNRTLYWRFSSSAGYQPGLVSAHLWFWLKEARTLADVRQWFDDHARDAAIDDGLFTANQLIFTADAVLGAGVTDPLPRRRGWLYGNEDEVDLPPPLPRALRPRPPRPPGEGVVPMGRAVAALSLLGDGPGLMGFHRPLRAASMQYANDVVRFGRPRDDDGEAILYRLAIDAAPARKRRGYLTDRYLADLIASAVRRVERGG